MLCLTQKCLSVLCYCIKKKTKKKNLFVKEDMAKKAVHVLADRSAMHIQLPNMCKDNVLFKLPQCLNGLYCFLLFFLMLFVHLSVKLLVPAPLYTIRAWCPVLYFLLKFILKKKVPGFYTVNHVFIVNIKKKWNWIFWLEKSLLRLRAYSFLTLVHTFLFYWIHPATQHNSS